ERKVIRLAVSSNAAIQAELPHKEFRFRCPAYPLRELKHSLAVNVSNFGLKESTPYRELQKRAKVKGVVMASWEKHKMKAAEEGGKEPTYVQLLYSPGITGE